MFISLSGNIGSGKDTVAEYLLENYNFNQFSFAGSVKDVLSIVFGWDREMLEGKTKEAREQRNIVDAWWGERLGIPDFTPRKAMQYIGTDLFRKHFNDLIWISSVERKISILGKGKHIVISDTRYINELAMLKNNKCITICIERGEKPKWYDFALKYNLADDETKVTMRILALTDPNPNIFNMNIHTSEWDWIGTEFDHILYNYGTLEELYEKIDMLLISVLE